MSIIPIYAAALAVLFVLLSVRTIKLRRRLQIAVGDGRNELMLRAMRAQANFAEYVPFSLILISLLESRSMSPWLIHGLCWLLLAGRVVHAFGISQSPERLRYRVIGMTFTFVAMGGAALAIAASYLIA